MNGSSRLCRSSGLLGNSSSRKGTAIASLCSGYGTVMIGYRAAALPGVHSDAQDRHRHFLAAARHLLPRPFGDQYCHFPFCWWIAVAHRLPVASPRPRFRSASFQPKAMQRLGAAVAAWRLTCSEALLLARQGAHAHSRAVQLACRRLHTPSPSPWPLPIPYHLYTLQAAQWGPQRRPPRRAAAGAVQRQAAARSGSSCALRPRSRAAPRRTPRTPTPSTWA